MSAQDTAGGLRIRWLEQAINQPPPEPPALVDGMLRAGELCVIGAPRGIGKSWFVKNLAVLLGHGTGYLAGALPIKRACRVLINHGEVDSWEASRRWRMLTGSDNPPAGVGETFDRWRIRTVRRRSTSSINGEAGRNVDTDEWVDAVLDKRLEATVAEHGFQVVIIDPWAVYFAGAENSNDETEAALDKLRDLAMRHSAAVVILHHIGKSTDAREPEDLWRGASRLADWASTRITILPHWTEQQARNQGMTRHQSRRYVDVKFLRRSTPTDDFSMVLDPESGWWNRWIPPEGLADSRRVHLETGDVVEACHDSGGAWASTRLAAETLGVAEATARNLLRAAQRAGAIEPFDGPRGAHGWRIPGPKLPT